MSITVRLWSDKELQEIRKGKNPLAATILLNKHTYSAKEINVVYGLDHHVYIVELEGQELYEDIEVRAVDLPSLWEFLALEYDLTHYPVVSIIEKIVVYVDVYPEGEG